MVPLLYPNSIKTFVKLVPSPFLITVLKKNGHPVKILYNAKNIKRKVNFGEVGGMHSTELHWIPRLPKPYNNFM